MIALARHHEFSFGYFVFCKLCYHGDHLGSRKPFSRIRDDSYNLHWPHAWSIAAQLESLVMKALTWAREEVVYGAVAEKPCLNPDIA